MIAMPSEREMQVLRIKEITDFLIEIGEAQRVQVADEALWNEPIVRVNTDTNAGKGELAWISHKQAKKTPDRLSTFKGSLLICPESSAESITIQSVAICCKNPKLAIIKVIDEFFSHLANTEWPTINQGSIHPSARIGQNVRLASGVVIGSGVEIESDVTIGPNTTIANSYIKKGVSIGANCTLGLPGFGYEKDELTGAYQRFPHIGGVIIEEGVEIGSNTCVDRGSIGNTEIHAGAKIDNLVHVAHNVKIGTNAMVIANSMIGGSTEIGANAWVAPSVSIMNQVSIGNGAILGLGAVVVKNVEPGVVVVGNPAKPLEKSVK